MQLVLGIVALVRWMGRRSNGGTALVATLVQSENLAMLLYIIGCLTLIVAGVASLVTAF